MGEAALAVGLREQTERSRGDTVSYTETGGERKGGLCNYRGCVVQSMSKLTEVPGDRPS